MASSFTRILLITHNQHDAVGGTPLDEWSARRRDLYLRTWHSRQTSMSLVGFEPIISADLRLRPRGHYSTFAFFGNILWVKPRWVLLPPLPMMMMMVVIVIMMCVYTFRSCSLSTDTPVLACTFQFRDACCVRYAYLTNEVNLSSVFCELGCVGKM